MIQTLKINSEIGSAECTWDTFVDTAGIIIPKTMNNRMKVFLRSLAP
jgi:hypothetical protein